jgi:hypothetical protein
MIFRIRPSDPGALAAIAILNRRFSMRPFGAAFPRFGRPHSCCLALQSALSRLRYVYLG